MRARGCVRAYPTPSPISALSQRCGLSKLIIFGLCRPETSIQLSLNNKRNLLASCNQKHPVVGLVSSEVQSGGLRMSKQTWFLPESLLRCP